LRYFLIPIFTPYWVQSEGAALRQIKEKLAALEHMEAAMRSNEAAAASTIHALQKVEWLRFWIQLGVQLAGSAYTPLLAALLLWAASHKEGWGWKITCGLCAYFLSPTAATLLWAWSRLWGFLKWLRSSPILPPDPTPATANSASRQERWWACRAPPTTILRHHHLPPPLKMK
jgi:hypothetical protein